MSCQKELSYESDMNLGHGTLYDSLKSCQPIVPNGTYYNGVSANRDTNYVKVIVTVTQTGNYTLTTDSTNGFGFRNSGYFSKLGADTLLLQAFGTPILNVPTDFTITLDSSTCGFTINVQDSTGTGLGGVDTSGTGPIDTSFATLGTWKFYDSTNEIAYTGTVANALQIADTLGANGPSTTGGYYFAVLQLLNNATIEVKPYLLDATVGTGLVALEDENNGNVGYNAFGDTPNDSADPSYIIITSYDATTKHVEGRFRCWARKDDNPGGAETVALVKGSFNCILQ